MTLRRPLLIAVAIPAALFLFLVLTLLFVPVREVQGVVERGLAREGYTLRAAGFGKAFPLGLELRDAHLSTDQGEVLRADRFVVRLRLLPLLGGKVVIGCEARIGAGKVTAEAALSGGGKTTVGITNLRLEDIPFFPSVTGAKVQGALTAQATLRGKGNSAAGELKLEVKAAEVSGVKIGGLPLPDATYRTVQGMLRAGGGKVVLESFTLDGEGLYVRLKGDFPFATPLSAAPLNLSLELMPKADFLDRQKFVFLLLTKYVTSPGHYEVPIRGTLAKPAVF